MPHSKDRKIEENIVGKDVWKWKDGVKAIVWRMGRHVFFQSMYEPFVNVWKRDNNMKGIDEMCDMKGMGWKG